MTEEQFNLEFDQGVIQGSNISSSINHKNLEDLDATWTLDFKEPTLVKEWFNVDIFKFGENVCIFNVRGLYERVNPLIYKGKILTSKWIIFLKQTNPIYIISFHKKHCIFTLIGKDKIYLHDQVLSFFINKSKHAIKSNIVENVAYTSVGY